MSVLSCSIFLNFYGSRDFQSVKNLRFKLIQSFGLFQSGCCSDPLTAGPMNYRSIQKLFSQTLDELKV